MHHLNLSLVPAQPIREINESSIFNPNKVIACSNYNINLEMIMMKIFSIALLSLTLCVNVFAQGNSANAPGKQKGPGQSAKELAPGQEKGAGQSAKQLAPGQQNKGSMMPMNTDGGIKKGGHGKGK